MPQIGIVYRKKYICIIFKTNIINDNIFHIILTNPNQSTSVGPSAFDTNQHDRSARLQRDNLHQAVHDLRDCALARAQWIGFNLSWDISHQLIVDSMKSMEHITLIYSI